MDNSSVWYDYFLRALYEKYPKKAQLTEALMDLLLLEREAVYRRLRKEVTFSVYDIAKIANAWNISIDNIFNIISEESSLFRMNVFSFNNPLEKDIKMLEYYLCVLREISTSDASEHMEISNILPRSLLGSYPMLSKFYMFKWQYHYGNDGNTCSFNQFILPERIHELGIEYSEEVKYITHVSYMWDNQIIQRLINDIRYIESVYLLSVEEVQFLKQEIYLFLDDMENLSTRGEFVETNNKVDLYISQVDIDTNYCYYYSPVSKICWIKAFVEYMVVSPNKLVCENFRKWMLAQKKFSIPISQVNERQRIEFFKRQRDLLKGLS